MISMKAKAIAAGLISAGLTLPLHASEAAPDAPPIEIIGASSGPPPQPTCAGPGCATVVSIRYLGKEWVPVVAADGPGSYVGVADGILVGAAEAPLIVGEAALDKDENIWTITVEFRSGIVETIAQSFPPLFKRGDWVLVEGNAIRIAQ
jgi:hypothetical protein